ncbi:MAG: hypothetical protein V4726_24000 [Verrucomicrobiota bacterium]
MSTLTLQLPEEDLQLFRDWIARRGLTEASGFSEMLHEARKTAAGQEMPQREIHPHVRAVTGILADDGRDYKAYREEYLDYLEEKHR